MSATSAIRESFRPSWKWWVVAFLPVLGLAIKQWNIPPLANAGDFGHYLLHALSLAEGRPYSDTGYIYTSLSPWVGPQNQLPVWPAILAPFVWAFGPLSIAPKLLTAAALVAYPAVAVRYFLRHESSVVAIAVCAILPVTLERSYNLSAPLSDLPFACFVWLLLVQGDAKREWTWPRIALLGALALLALGTRAAGIAILPALLIAACFRTPAERNRVFIVAAFGAVAGAAVLLLRHDSIPFMSMLAASPLSGIMGVARAARDYRLALFEATTYPTTINLLNDAYHVLAALIILIGIPEFIKRYTRTLLFSFTVCYVLMLMIVPVRDGRYTWPLWPVVLCVFVMGIVRLAEFSRKPAVQVKAPVIAVMMLSLAAAASLSAALRPRPETLIDRPTTLELFAWLRSQPGHEAFRVVYESPRIMALYARIPAMSPFRASAEVTQRELERQGITHAIFGGGVASRKVSGFPATLRSLQPEWRTVFENDDYEVLARPAPLQTNSP